MMRCIAYLSKRGAWSGKKINHDPLSNSNSNHGDLTTSETGLPSSISYALLPPLVVTIAAAFTSSPPSLSLPSLALDQYVSTSGRPKHKTLPNGQHFESLTQTQKA